jgi:hypothetical protein
MEYEALLNVERMVRLAMAKPATGEFLVGAMQALDAVRRDEKRAEPVVAEEPRPSPVVVAVANALIDKVRKP